MPAPARRVALERWLARLATPLGERLSTDPLHLAAVVGDESGLPPGEAAAVVWPASTADLVAVTTAAAELAVPLVPRGAGTGKAGGCIPQRGQVVVDLSRMNRIVEMRADDLYAVVEPGLITAELDTAAGEHGLFYPPDPGSRESCTLGGNIATNAGGPRAVKYGVTHHYVWGLEVVLPGGDVLRTGKRSIKGVAGYDLTSLFVGSEGTLGFVARAVLHLIPRPPDVQTAWLSFTSLAALQPASRALFGAGLRPRMLEMMDEVALDLVRPNSDFRIPPAAAALLVETDGQPDEAFAQLSRLCELALGAGASDAIVATRERDREGMRRARRLVSSTMKERYPHKISDDIAVPRSRMTEMLARARDCASQEGLAFSAYGHLGDGNLHVNLLCEDALQRQQACSAQRAILAAVVAMGGTISGEHGLGSAKRELLALEHDPTLLAWQGRLKRTLDPQGIMNPGKALPD